MIEVEHVNIVYPGGVRALEDATFRVDPGECVALAGANGAGKSTLLLALLGIVPAVSGVIRVGGVTLSARTAGEIRKKAGLLFQNPDDQLFSPRVYDDVAFGLRNEGLSEDEVARRAGAALARLGIAHLRDRMPHHLSWGEKRSVAVAGLLAMEPSALLLDEPTSFLDPRARRSLIGTIAGMKLTRLIATHDLDMALEACDRVLILQGGRLAAGGPAGELLTDRALLERCGLELPLSLSGR